MTWDAAAFVDLIRSLERAGTEARSLFDPAAPVIVTRAPGRLDVMGGIADYSGSLVLQRPIAEATFAAVQPSDRPLIEIVSCGREPGTRPRVFRMDLASLAPKGESVPYAQAQEFFRAEPDHHWAAYVAGVFPVLMRERGASFTAGAKILVSSSVPEGKGVASSAALEVAAMKAVVETFGIELEANALALLCQTVENRIAGAPCGVMDQMTSVFGRADSLLALLCQPARLEPDVPLPEAIALWGLDSGERHAVTGSSYEAVRTGAFMGLRILGGEHDPWSGYLANISPDEFERELLPRLPEELSGKEFLDRYSRTSDTVTRVDPSRVYGIRRPTAHPVYEHHRVRMFRDILRGSPGEKEWVRLGELMYASHASYTACGLGSRGTDLIVELVRREGAAAGLYGARITGGGSGGTVAVLGRADAGAAITRVAARYREITGYNPFIFAGASDGAAVFGSLRLKI